MLLDARVHRAVLEELVRLGARRRALEERQDFLGVVGHVGAIDHVRDAPVLVDDEGHAVGHPDERLGGREEARAADRAVGAAHGAALVGEQGKVEPVLRR